MHLAEHRDHVIEQLSSGFAGDLFEVEELERRVALAHAAETPAALDALVVDLAPARYGSAPRGALLAPSHGSSSTALLAPSAEYSALAAHTAGELVHQKRLRATFGAIERTGVWTLPPQLFARVTFGHVLLDLREAHLPPSATIDVRVTFGNVEILVPPTVAVEVDVAPVLGNVEDRTNPGAVRHRLRVTGRVRLGNVEVTTRHGGECVYEARWRRQHERRMLRD